MIAKTYIFKMQSRLSLAALSSKLEEHGVIESMREHVEPNQVAPLAIKIKRSYTESPETTARRSQVRLAQVEDKKQKVHDVLAPILQKHPFAPLSVIVKQMNQTEVRNERGTDWTEQNIQSYVTYTMDKLTQPEEQQARNTRPQSTPPG